MVVTEIRGKIYFYQGESLFRKVSTLCSEGISSVLFDNDNQMIVLCFNSIIYIYNVNVKLKQLIYSYMNLNLKYSNLNNLMDLLSMILVNC